jgi:hypothetical protein
VLSSFVNMDEFSLLVFFAALTAFPLDVLSGYPIHLFDGPKECAATLRK